MLKALGMKVVATRRSHDKELRKELGLEWLGDKDEIDKLMQLSDFLVVTIPLTPDTKGLVGEHEIRQMKQGSYLINIARAAIVEEKALYEALKDGHLAGAAIDVWWQPHFWDPLWNLDGNPASKYPFWELENVICIPHNIGFTEHQSDASLEIMVENILRIRDGKSPTHQVDKQFRY